MAEKRPVVFRQGPSFYKPTLEIDAGENTRQPTVPDDKKITGTNPM